jgi:hypothetical protein
MLLWWNLSVRKGEEERLLFTFGKDKCRVCFSGSAWTRPKVEQGIIPKDEDYGLIIFAFQSHGFKFGMTLSPEEQEKVNKF